MCGQMKTMLDRGNPLYVSDYKFSDVYFLATAAEEGDHAWSRAVSGLEGWIACFERAHLSGVVFAGGVINTGEIGGHPSLDKAFEMGKIFKSEVLSDDENRKSCINRRMG
jgi:hypothetical protein